MLHPVTLFFAMALVPVMTAVLMHAFSGLSWHSPNKSAYNAFVLTLVLLLATLIGAIAAYGTQTWDLLAVFAGAGLLSFVSFARASVVFVVTSPVDTEDVDNQPASKATVTT